MSEQTSGLTSIFSKTFHYFQTYWSASQINVTGKFSTLRHSAPLVYYAGVHTTVAFTIFGEKQLPQERRIFLQRRGWRTGLFGWTIGSLMGGSKLPGIEVTPDSKSASISADVRKGIEDFHRHVTSAEAKKQVPLQTDRVHIPVKSGDGYFRLRVTSEDSYDTIATTCVFRVASASMSSASPRGADIVTLPLELAFKTAQVASVTAAYTALFTALPFLKIAQLMPGTWQKRAINNLWGWADGEQKKDDIMQRYDVDQKLQTVQGWGRNIDSSLPWSRAGVRRREHLQEDAKMGRGGDFYNHKRT